MKRRISGPQALLLGGVLLACLFASGRDKKKPAASVPAPAGEPYRGKVESLVIVDSLQAQAFRALAITDNDNGQSELLELELSWPGGPAD